MRAYAAVAGLLALLAAAPAQAQGEPDVNDLAGYFGINFTPTGLLTPMPSSSPAAGMGFNVRVGTLDVGDDARTLGAGIDFGAGAGRFGVQASFSSIDCDNCDGLFGIGADLDWPLWTSVSGATSPASFAIGLRPAFGWGKGTGSNDDLSAMSLAASVPVTMTMGRTTKFVAFLTPGFGWGRVSDSATNDSESGTRPMVGGGIGVNMTNGIGLNVGFNRVFVEDIGETTFGVGFSWHGVATP